MRLPGVSGPQTAATKRVAGKMLEHLFVLAIVSSNVSAVLHQMPTEREGRPPVWGAAVVLTGVVIVAYLWAKLLLWVGRRFCRWVREN